MKNFILSLITLFAFGGILSSAQNKKFSVYAVGFYNLENLFDTCHDEGKNDYEFLADGTYKWNKIKY